MATNLLIASHNLGKIAEFKKYSQNYFDNILSCADFATYSEVSETGSTLFSNACLKCDSSSRLVTKKTFILSDDSGLFIDALNGEPGIKTARYAGESCNSEDVNQKILHKLRDIPENLRTGYIACILILRDHQERKHLFEGKVNVHIPLVPQGQSGFGQDSIMIPEGSLKSFAEMSRTEKSHYDHRGKAMTKLTETLSAWKNSGYL